jgi:predicted flavoprotein YhiN
MPPTTQRHVAVVGAGAAGLTAAIRAAEGGARVTLLNAHPRIGLKILMSGGTRCNVTHREVTERDYHGGSRPFVARVLRAFTPEQTREWFESLGVELKLEETGKYFPVTDDADTVLQALLAEARRAGVEVQSGARVVRLERAADPADADDEDEARATSEGMPEAPDQLMLETPTASPRFRLGIQTVRSAAVFEGGVSRRGEARWPLPAIEPDRWLEMDAVVIATGGLSFPRTGSDGVGYALVTGLGHTLEPPVPALTPLASDDALCLAAQGITLEVELSLWVDGKRAEKVVGSMVIAHFGYSGPAALDLSRHWHRAEGSRLRVTASFAPGESAEKLHAAWVDAARNAPERTVRRHLARWLPERLAERLAEETGTDPGTRVGQVPRERREALIERVLARDLGVTGTLGYEKAEVTAGGVRLSEVNPSTLESRIVPGLYLCGEILDVEGRLGGFNFQWSWSSGTVAGRAAAST